MKSALLTGALLAAVAFMAQATAEERRTVSQMALYGSWLGTQGAMAADCNAPGYWVWFSTSDTGVTMAVQTINNGVRGPITESQYGIGKPPAGAPERLDIFLTGKKGDLAFDMLTGSKLEIVPPGPDKSYGATSLYLQRCS